MSRTDNIPSQVDEAADLALKLHEKMYNAADDEEEKEDEESFEEDTPEEDEPEDDEEDTPHDDDLEELRKFKQRYLSLKGKYDAEVPRLHQDLRELKQSVFDRLEAMAEKPPVTEKQVADSEDAVAKLKEEYGDDFIDSISHLIEQITKKSISPVQEKVSSVEESQVKMVRDEFMAYLDDNVKGDWKTLWSGKDEGFIAFLNKPDPSGLYTYRELAQLYNDQWDADKLSKVFNIYIESTETKPAKEKKPNPEKEALVAPSRKAQSNTPSGDEKTIWTKDSIKEFQRLDRMNKFTPEESKAKWDDLLAAANEGRIR